MIKSNLKCVITVERNKKERKEGGSKERRERGKQISLKFMKSAFIIHKFSKVKKQMRIKDASRIALFYIHLHTLSQKITLSIWPCNMIVFS